MFAHAKVQLAGARPSKRTLYLSAAYSRCNNNETEIAARVMREFACCHRAPYFAAQPAQRVRAGKKARKRKENVSQGAQGAAAAGFVDVYGPQVRAPGTQLACCVVMRRYLDA